MSFGSGGPPPTLRLSCAEVHDLLAAYVLDSLDSREEDGVCQHVDTCRDCRAEAEELRAVAMQVGEAVAEVAPPADLRGRILTQVRAESQVGSPMAPASPVSSARVNKWQARRWSPWIAAAAAALIAISAGSWALVEHYSAPGHHQQGLTAVKLNPLDKLIASGNSTVITLNPSRNSGAHGALVTDPRTGTTYLLLSSVSELRSQQVYTLWYMAVENGSLTPVRIGQVKRAGAYRINRSPNGFTRIAVTREPRPGDKSPQGPVLMAAALS